MTPTPRQPLSLDDLTELYQFLERRVERLTGIVEQLKLEGRHDALTRPTWRDVEALKKDIARLEGLLSSRRRPRRLPRGKEGV